jgi:tripartite-type tricarboxylate transporter receptor subunit TctC
MQFSRLRLLCLLTLTIITLAAATGNGVAQTKFPVKPIRLIVASSAASQPDMIARLIGQKMTETWGYAVVVDNRPGAAGTMAASAVAKATPDGHTLLYAPPNFAINAALQTTLPYDPYKDIAPVAHVGISTNILVAAPGVGAKTVKEFIAIARSQPNKFILASSTPGSAGYLSGARFNLITGIKAIHVPFKGSPEATIELLGGRAHYHVGTMGVALPFVKEGKLVPLGVTSPQRSPLLPDVPALGEILAEFARPETSHGILAPAGTPRSIVSQIANEVLRILNLPDVRERLGAISYVVAPANSDEYAKILRGQIEALTAVGRDTGLRGK